MKGGQVRIYMRAAALLLLVLAVTLTPLLASAQEEFLIGLIPEENIFRQIQRHRPLAKYLSEKLGTNVRFTILSRYGDIVDRFVSRNMDGAFFGIFTSVLAQEKLGVEPLVRPVNPDGSTTARGYLIVRKDSGIKTAADIKGKRAVFVDKATATGYLFAVAYLREKGIKDLDSYFSEYYFTGSHDTAVYAVLDGRADVGTVKSRILEKLISKDPLIKDEILVLASSISLPDTTLCVRKDIPEELKQKLKDTLLTMHQDPRGIEVLEKLGALRFVEAHKADFEVVTELAEKAGIDIKQYSYR
jgi:phosphonate transport system substrate-binding protein